MVTTDRSRFLPLLVPLVVVVAGAWHRRIVLDDGFINLQVVRQVLAGNGPVFNAGQRVEAFTSPLWLFMLVVGDLVLPVRPEWIAVYGGIICTAVGFAAAMLAATILTTPQGEDRPARLFIPAGALVLVALPPVWQYATTGLETGLSFGWLGVSALLLARWARDERPLGRGAAIVLGLGPLVRPDLALCTATFLAAVLLDGKDGSWRRRLSVAAWALALPVAYEIFRMGYYGMVVPNTALAKSAGRSDWQEGWRYVRDTVDPYWLWVPLLIVALALFVPLLGDLWQRTARRRQLAVAALVCGGGLCLAYVVRVGGDYMHSRLLLPGLFAVLAPVAAVPVRRRYLASVGLVPWVVIAIAVLRSPKDAVGVFVTGKRNAVTLAENGYGPDSDVMRVYRRPGVYVNTVRLDVPAPRDSHGRPTVAVAVYGIGMPAYASPTNVRVFDLLGLANPLGSHLDPVRKGLPGHDKLLPWPWMVAELTPPGTEVAEPTMGSPYIVRQDDPGSQPFDRRVAIARRVLRCSPVREVIDAAEAPMSAGRFWHNLTHAFTVSRMALPPEPRHAAAKLCR